MQDLNDLYYYAEVVEHGGFSAAARVLGLPKSKLSRRLALLEERLFGGRAAGGAINSALNPALCRDGCRAHLLRTLQSDAGRSQSGTRSHRVNTS